MAAEETKLSSSHRNNSILERRFRHFDIVNSNSDRVKAKEISAVGDRPNQLRAKFNKAISLLFRKDRTGKDVETLRSSGHQPTEAPPVQCPQQTTETPDQQFQIKCDVVVNIEQLSPEPQPQDGLSESGLGLSIEGPVGLEVSLSDRANPQIYQPELNSGRLGFVVDLTLGPNRSNPIWRLRLLSSFTLVTAAMYGLNYLPEILQGIHEKYRIVILGFCVGSPISVSAMTLVSSFWLSTPPYIRTNWITGLSIANLCMLGGLFAVYLTAK